MSFPFNPSVRRVNVTVLLTGPRRTAEFDFALDTACTRTAVSGFVLASLGYTPEQATGRHQVRTGSGGTRAGVLPVTALSALGRTYTNYPVLWLDIPPATLLDGLLGLDFLRGEILTLDFARGRIDLGPPRPWWKVWK